MGYERIRRRRSSGSPIRRAWKRIQERIPPGGTTATLFAALIVLGVAMLQGGGKNVFAGGVTACAIGSAGLVWQAWDLDRADWLERQRRNMAERKSETHKLRRQREAEEQEERKRRAATDAAARERAKETQATVRRAATDKAAAERAWRRGRDEAIARDAMRLLTMSEITLMDAAAEAFVTRGFTVGRDVDDSKRDMDLRGEEGEIRIVARLAPPGRKVDVADVDALESWRGETGAAAGILIGIGGFTPEAIQRASTIPATLAEAHLLAQWRVGGPLTGEPPALEDSDEDED